MFLDFHISRNKINISTKLTNRKSIEDAINKILVETKEE